MHLKIINKKKKNENCSIIFIVVLIVGIFIVFIFFNKTIVSYIGIWHKKQNINNENCSQKISLSYFFINDGNDYEAKYYIINEKGSYEICIFGASAIEGGKGGKVCSQHHFERGDIINFYFEGRAAGGKGGKNCGIWNGNDAYDGAGLGQARLRKHEEEFTIIAGGGGGSSEKNYNKGGNAEENGAGKYGGKGAKNNSFGVKGDNDAKDGDYFLGGEGGNSYFGYCGGGGGNGYFGGGGGGSSLSSSDVGGGGGGSNLCVSKYECNYYYNDKLYSGVILKQL